MKEISPKEMQNYCEKSLKETKRFFRKRIREIAKGGNNYGSFDVGQYTCEEEIIEWLKSLGFTVSRENSKVMIFW